jgi:hypothetical protein
MIRPTAYVVRASIGLGGLVLWSLLAGTPAAGRSPYVSALSSLGSDQAFAAAYCNNKACVGGSRFNLSCGSVDHSHCEKYGRNLCSSNPC